MIVVPIAVPESFSIKCIQFKLPIFKVNLACAIPLVISHATFKVWFSSFEVRPVNAILQIILPMDFLEQLAGWIVGFRNPVFLIILKNFSRNQLAILKVLPFTFFFFFDVSSFGHELSPVVK